MVDAIKDCSHRGDIVLDPFGGSGTTLIAAHRAGRKARLMEFDPRYVDLIVRRFQAVTGQQAVLEADGRTFETISSLRARQENAAKNEIAVPTGDANREQGGDV